MALSTARIHRVRGRPPLLAAGIKSLIHSHSSSVRSLGYIVSFIIPCYTTHEDFSDSLLGGREVKTWSHEFRQRDILCDAGSAKLTTLRAPVKLLGDQPLLSAQEGIERHEGRHLFEALAAEGVGKHREATTLRVRQAQPAATELGFEDTIFLKEIHDDLLLVPLEPSCDHGDQDLEDHRAPQVGSSDTIAWPVYNEPGEFQWSRDG